MWRMLWIVTKSLLFGLGALSLISLFTKHVLIDRWQVFPHKQPVWSLEVRGSARQAMTDALESVAKHSQLERRVAPTVVLDSTLAFLAIPISCGCPTTCSVIRYRLDLLSGGLHDSTLLADVGVGEYPHSIPGKEVRK